MSFKFGGLIFFFIILMSSLRCLGGGSEESVGDAVGKVQTSVRHEHEGVWREDKGTGEEVWGGSSRHRAVESGEDTPSAGDGERGRRIQAGADPLCRDQKGRRLSSDGLQRFHPATGNGTLHTLINKARLTGLAESTKKSMVLGESALKMPKL